MSFFDKLKTGLNKTKESFNTKINDVFSNFRKVDEEFLEELEEVLIMSDMGVDTSVKIVNNLRKRIKRENIKEEEDVKQALREEISLLGALKVSQVEEAKRNIVKIIRKLEQEGVISINKGSEDDILV